MTIYYLCVQCDKIISSDEMEFAIKVNNYKYACDDECYHIWAAKHEEATQPSEYFS